MSFGLWTRFRQGTKGRGWRWVFNRGLCTLGRHAWEYGTDLGYTEDHCRRCLFCWRHECLVLVDFGRRKSWLWYPADCFGLVRWGKR